MDKKKKENEAKPKKKRPTEYILMTQYKDGDPEITGVFSSFDKAVADFVLTEFVDEEMGKEELLLKATQVALKMAHKTEDLDWADFGDKRAWVDELKIDARCEAWDWGDGDDSK